MNTGILVVDEQRYADVQPQRGGQSWKQLIRQACGDAVADRFVGTEIILCSGREFQLRDQIPSDLASGFIAIVESEAYLRERADAAENENVPAAVGGFGAGI